MQPQPLLEPMMFLALIPTGIFIGLVMIIVRRRTTKLTMYQRWMKDNQSPS